MTTSLPRILDDGSFSATEFRQIQALSERVTQRCPLDRWPGRLLEGVRLLDAHGEEYTVTSVGIYGDDTPFFALTDTCGDAFDYPRDLEERPALAIGLYLDWRSPATCGAVLALARELWDCCAYRRLTIEVAGPGFCVVVQNGRHRPPSRAQPSWTLDPVAHPGYLAQLGPLGSNEFSTEAEALVAAVVSAPEVS